MPIDDETYEKNRLTSLPDLPVWICPCCRLHLALYGRGDGVEASISAIIRSHCETHGMDATAIRAELDRMLKAITL